MKRALICTAMMVVAVGCKKDDRPSGSLGNIFGGGGTAGRTGGSGGTAGAAGDGGAGGAAGQTGGSGGDVDSGTGGVGGSGGLGGEDAGQDTGTGGDISDAADDEIGTNLDVFQPEGGNPDPICDYALAWWTTSYAFDPAVTPQSFVDAVDGLSTVAEQHIVTIATKDAGGSWTVAVSGTVDNGSFQQMYPNSNLPTFTGLTRHPGSFETSSPQATGYIRVRDAGQQDVWIEMQEITAKGTYGDAICETLSSGSVDATIPTAAGATSIQLAGQSTTLSALLGSPTSSNPPGWPIRFTYTATRVTVDLKNTN
jgi:hypothetical protein